jgi:hypothetical protein
LYTFAAMALLLLAFCFDPVSMLAEPEPEGQRRTPERLQR